MRNTLKKIVIPFATLSLLTTPGMVFADEVAVDEPMVISPVPVMNGATADGIEIVVENEIAMFPLRQVAETLGYTVEWNEEDESVTLTKGAQYIRMAIGKDEYSFGRMAPAPLGSAPVLVNDCTTYVPLNFVTDVIGGYYRVNEDGTYKIVNPSIVSVTEINEDGSILVADDFLGEIIVFIDENTTILGNGEIMTADSIEKDMVLAIEYSPAMTMSIPAQTTAIEIHIQNLPVDEIEAEVTEEVTAEAPTFSGVITEIDGEMVMVGEPREANSVRLIVTEDTTIEHIKNKRIYKLQDLEVGMEISGTLSEAMTMSIPPQSVALSIVIEK